MSFSTPIVFIIFNRPDLTRKVFQAIAGVKPEKLFVVADGPRFPEEAEKCKETRAIIDEVDWECEVLTNYSEENLGCGKRVSSGIDWVFSNVEEAIFLEDDCLPVESFFSYCQTLLEFYRYDERIMNIGGNNFQSGYKRTEYSYHFSKYNGCWGWATWRRAWQLYDFDMNTWPEFKEAGMLNTICEDPYERDFFDRLFESMYDKSNREDTWDYQWKYACWSQNGLSIEPSVNLVSNLGLGRSDATHTTGQNPLLDQILITREIGEIKHPPIVGRHQAADAYIFDYIVGGNQMKKFALLKRLRRQMSVIKNKIAGNNFGH